MFKNDEVIDILVTTLRFSRAENVCAETLQNKVTATTQCFLFK